MYKEDFYDFDGSLADCLAKVTDYIIREGCTNAKLVIIEQTSTIHLQLIWD